MESDFSPLVDVLDEAAVGEGVSEGVSGLGKNGENNGEGSDDALQEDGKISLTPSWVCMFWDDGVNLAGPEGAC